MSDKELMLKLPEVAYLVDRVPIMRLVLKPKAVHLRFLQHARDSKMSLKEQCAAFDVPWHARKVPAATASDAVLEASRLLSAVDFGQTFPGDNPQRWAINVVGTRQFTPSARRWVAFHGHEIADFGAISGYLRDAYPPVSTSYESVLKKARERQRGFRVGLYADGGLVLPRDLAALVHPRFIFDPREDLVEDLDRTDVQYDERLKGFRHGDLSVDLLSATGDFDEAGIQLRNCIASTGTSPIAPIVFTAKRNYFSAAKGGYIHTAVVKRDSRYLAAFTLDPRWNIREIKAGRNAEVADQQVFAAADAFVAHAKRLAAGEVPISGRNAEFVIVDEAAVLTESPDCRAFSRPIAISSRRWGHSLRSWFFGDETSNGGAQS